MAMLNAQLLIRNYGEKGGEMHLGISFRRGGRLLEGSTWLRMEAEILRV